MNAVERPRVASAFTGSACWSSGAVAEITADHVFTCFKVLNWTPHPANYAQVLSDLKRKQKSFDKGDTTGGYKMWPITASGGCQRGGEALRRSYGTAESRP